MNRNPKIDITGQRFSRLLVLSEALKRGNKSRWLCRCDCGTHKIIFGFSLRFGNTRSCGCLARELSIKRKLKHGHCRKSTGKPTREYTAWRRMLARCYGNNPNNVKYYRQRGIVVCDRWRQFPNFLTDMGVHPGEGFSLDRIDFNGNYEPANCRWANSLVQSRNRRRYGTIDSFTTDELERELIKRKALIS